MKDYSKNDLPNLNMYELAAVQALLLSILHQCSERPFSTDRGEQTYNYVKGIIGKFNLMDILKVYEEVNKQASIAAKEFKLPERQENDEHVMMLFNSFKKHIID